MIHLKQISTVVRQLFAVFGLVMATSPAASGEEEITFYIREYRVEGAKRLPRLVVERAVYPFLGPRRGVADVEQARAALEKSYHDEGYQTVSVAVPQQDPRRGIIRLEVVESKVGRLRINGAKFFLPSQIKREAPSLAEGNVPNMNEVTREIVALNQLADRRVTPSLRAGLEPGTVDIDLDIEDELPLHGSLELNNRYSADTTALRLNGSLSYGNLFQKGHTGGVSFQIAPENIDDAVVYSGYYLARVSDSASLMIQGTKQNSDISTLGGVAVGGRGEILGVRALFDLPTTTKFYQNFSIGFDFKSFEEDLVIGPDTISSPIEYYPISASHSATWMSDKTFTEMNHSLAFGLRGVGSGDVDYANKRYKADGNFVYLRSDLAHAHDIKSGAQVYGKIQSQIANRPLINSDQIAGGGLGSVRGYLEATSVGDNGLFGTVELRSPSLIGNPDKAVRNADEWRFHAFTDAGIVGIWDALLSQKSQLGLFSAGAGTRFKVGGHYNGSLDIATPFTSQPNAESGDVRVTFRGWADF